MEYIFKFLQVEGVPLLSNFTSSALENRHKDLSFRCGVQGI